MFIKLLAFTGVFLSLLASNVQAHPVAYAGSYSIMTWNNKDMSDWMLTHSFTSNFALTARYLRLNTKEGERTFYMPQASYLLKRWNELDSQANIYLSVSQGVEKKNTSYKSATGAAVETDWESRKYYVSFREDVLIDHNNSSKNIYQTKVRAGFAPYLAQFNEINSWFILQAENNNKDTEKFKLTPFIRFFYHNVLTEVGVSSKGDAQFNFMVHF